MSNNGTVHAVSAVIAGIGLQPPPPSVPAPPLLQTATQIGPLQSATQVASRPMQTQTLHPQAMVHSATAVPPPPMSTASAVVAQSSHYVMQQALSLQPDDMIKVYENLRKHLHNEGLLRGMSVSARTKRRVDCLKDGCPGCKPLALLAVSPPAFRLDRIAALSSAAPHVSRCMLRRRADGIQEAGHVQRRQRLRLPCAVGLLSVPTGQARLQTMHLLKWMATGSS